jgi:putative copper export protein
VTETVAPALIVVRFFTFGLAILAFGAAAFALYAPTASPPRSRVRLAPPLLLALSAGAYAVLVTREASGTPGFPPLPLIGDILTTTGFGRALATVVVSALLLVGTAASAWETRWLRLALSGAAMVALAFVGHAADDGGAGGAVRLALMALHLMAIGFWLGALPSLWGALRWRSTDTVELLNRFGLVGGAAAVVVLASGLGTVGLMAVDARGALGAVYVRVLALKLAFVVALLALAAVNRFRLTPMMSRDPDRARRELRRTIVIEQVVAVCALACVSLLGQLDPGM